MLLQEETKKYLILTLSLNTYFKKVTLLNLIFFKVCLKTLITIWTHYIFITNKFTCESLKILTFCSYLSLVDVLILLLNAFHLL